jgi:AraC-like DNA-binding protein
MTPPVRYEHLESLVDVKRRLMKSVAAGEATESALGMVRELGRTVRAVAAGDRRAAVVILLSAAEELRQAIGPTEQCKAMLESAMACPAASPEDALGAIEAALLAMIERQPPRPRTSERVRTILDIIDRRYVEPLKIVALAEHVRRGRAQVAAQFRRETGFTIHRYLTYVRMRRAAELLRAGEKVEAVTLLVGYNSKKSFYSQFRAYTGRTPGKFRDGQGEFRDGRLSYIPPGETALAPATPRRQLRHDRADPQQEHRSIRACPAPRDPRPRARSSR